MKNLTRGIFLVVLFGILLLQSIPLLFTFLSMLWLVSYKDFFKLNKRVLRSIVWFNLSVTIGYIVMSFVEGFSPWSFLLYINMKVYLLTYFVFYFFSKVDMLEFFSFSKDLSYLLSISLSQIISYKKTFEEFKLAYRARIVRKLRDRKYKFITQVFEFFLLKTLGDAKERTMAMKARGFFDNAQ